MLVDSGPAGRGKEDDEEEGLPGARSELITYCSTELVETAKRKKQLVPLEYYFRKIAGAFPVRDKEENYEDWHAQALSAPWPPPPPVVVVAGGGPAGLLHAIAAAQGGASVALFERRTERYDRDVWFDIAGGNAGVLDAMSGLLSDYPQGGEGGLEVYPPQEEKEKKQEEWNDYANGGYQVYSYSYSHDDDGGGGWENIE